MRSLYTYSLGFLDHVRRLSELAKIQVMNNLGQIVYSKEIKIQNNCINETIEIDKSAPSGIYSLQVIIGNKVENTNVVLAR